MKNSSKLTKISLTISILGILILLIISQNIEPEFKTIQQIKQIQLNKNIKTQATITKLKTISKSFQILTLQDSTDSIQATLDKKTNLKINQSIIIYGKTTQYKDKIQIQASKILKK